jgi:hypothetical protein
MAVVFDANTDTIWAYLSARVNNDYGVAGLMGNLWAESGCNPINVENGYGWTDQTYTDAVDNGTENFMRDYLKSNGSYSPLGYGIAQWTYASRKQALYNMKLSMGVSIGNLGLQCDYLWQELQTSYVGTLNAMINATSVRQCSDYVLANFENPADQSEDVKIYRASLGQKFYDHYSGQPPVPPEPPIPAGTKMPFIFMCGSKRQKIVK